MHSPVVAAVDVWFVMVMVYMSDLIFELSESSGENPWHIEAANRHLDVNSCRCGCDDGNRGPWRDGIRWSLVADGGYGYVAISLHPSHYKPMINSTCIPET